MEADRYGTALYQAHLNRFGPDSPLRLDADDHEAVEGVKKKFDRTKELWQEAKDDGQRARARSLAKSMRKQLFELEEITTKSHTNSAKSRNDDSRYKLLQDRIITGCSFSQVSSSRTKGHKIPSCVFHFRKRTTDRLVKWLAALRNRDKHNPTPLSTRRVHHLVGGRGFGKTVLLHAIAKLLKEEKALAASFVFSNDTPPDFEWRMVATLVDQVAGYLQSFKSEICLLDLSAKNFVDQTIRHQTSSIFIRAASRVSAEERLFFVFDGLDDCEPNVLDHVFEFMHQSLENLPNVYFITASRNSNRIQSALIRSRLNEKSSRAPDGHVEETGIEDFRQAYEDYRRDNPDQFA
ncbi:hypothetical protein NMY22_g16578 [Coprinellus aureogranulatus]|nr:hypothetical protein NMY22_g16578 [Coprinellus aureogranulatus]